VEPGILPSLAGLIEAIGGAGFEARLLDVAEAAGPGDASMSLMFSTGAAPLVLVDRLDAAERPFLYGDYLAGVYLVSPFYRAALDGGGARVCSLAGIAPKGFRQSDYYRKYYSRIGVADLLGVLLPAGAGGSSVRFLSLSRSAGRRAFGAGERRALAGLLPVLEAAARRHDQVAGPRPDAGQDGGETPRAIFGAGLAKPLTEREAEVVEALLAGHSEKSAARALAISAETVKVHRRHAYKKLGVATKGELFSLFVARVRKG
jgi:DNA-binding CsgD family transcriptional regulator